MKLCKCGAPAYRSPKGQQSGLCSKCRSQRTMKYRKQNPDIQKQSDLLRKFGITLDQYKAMLAAQNNVCAICKQSNSDGRSFAVDHDHKTGKNRGLLCGNCNRGIGNLKETPAILWAAIEYLNAYTVTNG
jgi:hypothetical protein